MVLLYIPIKGDDYKLLSDDAAEQRYWIRTNAMRTGVGIALSDTHARARFMTVLGAEPDVKVISGLRCRKTCRGIWRLDLKFADLSPEVSVVVRQGVFKKGNCEELALYQDMYDYYDAL